MNECILSFLKNMFMEEEFLRLEGNSFQILGPLTYICFNPQLVVQANGTKRLLMTTLLLTL